MIPLFLDPRPDELFYSVCARTQDAMRFDQKRSIGQYLFGNRYTNAVIDLPSRLGYVVDALPPGHRYTVDRLIDECTLLPFYTPFLPPNHVARIRMAMSNRHNEDAQWLGAVMGRHILTGMLRFCPRCAEEERAEFGMCYWHRLHQIPCVLVCPTHLVVLEHSTIPMRDTANPYTFVSAERAIRTVPVARMLTMEPIHSQLIRLAESAIWLLKQPNLMIGPDALSLRYRSVLLEQGLAAVTGSIYWAKLRTVLGDSYSSELLLHLGCPPDEKVIVEWFKRVASTGTYSRNPIYHLLLMEFLGYSSESFFRRDPEWKPFGDGPWPCLNPACDHFKQTVIQHVEINLSCTKHSHVRGVFTCVCGFAYARHGPDPSPRDQFQKTKITSYGSVWEAKLQELSKEPSISLKEAARRLGVGDSVIRNNLVRLGLVFVTKHGLMTLPDAEKPPNSEVKEQRYQHLREKHRAVWLKVRQDYPSAMLQELICMASGSYVWLLRNDKDWLFAHRPEPKRPKLPLRNFVDWPQRDEELAEQVKIYAQHLFNLPGRPVRITKRKILLHLNPFVKVSTYQSKVPLTMQVLAQVIETREAYIIRKIWWVATQYQDEQQLPGWNELRRWACVPKDVVSPDVERAIDAALEMLRQTASNASENIDYPT